MKTARKIVSLFLSLIVLLCAILPISAEFTDTGWWGDGENIFLDYPLTSRFVKEYCSTHLGGMAEWYMYDYERGIEFMSSLWLKYYYLGDPEILCEDYINKFEVDIANAYSDRPPHYNGSGTQLYGYTVNSYFWEGNTLSASCTMDYDITYSCSSEFDNVYIDVGGDLNAYIYLAFTDKLDDSLVNLAKIADCCITPEYKYGSPGHRIVDEEYPLDKELQYIMNTDRTIDYTCTDTADFSVEMPSFYDPLKHDVTLYFYAFDPEYYRDLLPYGDGFYNPTVLTRDDIPTPEVVRGDADGDGVLNLSDVTVTLKYLAEWENITIDETAADTNGNGSVNLTDVSFMLQLIAGWNV